MTLIDKIKKQFEKKKTKKNTKKTKKPTKKTPKKQYKKTKIPKKTQKITKAYKKYSKKKPQIPKTTTTTTTQGTGPTQIQTLDGRIIKNYRQLLEPIVKDEKLIQKIIQYHDILIGERLTAHVQVFGTQPNTQTNTHINTIKIQGILLEEEQQIHQNLTGQTGQLTQIMQEASQRIKQTTHAKDITWGTNPTGSQWTITNITVTFTFA